VFRRSSLTVPVGVVLGFRSVPKVIGIYASAVVTGMESAVLRVRAVSQKKRKAMGLNLPPIYIEAAVPKLSDSLKFPAMTERRIVRMDRSILVNTIPEPVRKLLGGIIRESHRCPPTRTVEGPGRGRLRVAARHSTSLDYTRDMPDTYLGAL
jgi:hypothetical protein